MPDKEELVTRKWVYGGRTPIAGTKKLGAIWWDPDVEEGNEKVFPLFRHLTIGAAYEVSATPDGTRASTKGARFVEANAADEEMIRSWTLADRAAYTNDERRKMEDRAKRDGDRFGSMTLDEVQNFIDTRPSQATAMIAQVIRHITARPRR